MQLDAQHVSRLEFLKVVNQSGPKRVFTMEGLLGEGLRQVGVTVQHQARRERIEFTRILIWIVKHYVS